MSVCDFRALCDSADADGIIEKYFEVEEQNQARMSLLLEQETHIQQLKKEIELDQLHIFLNNLQ